MIKVQIIIKKKYPLKKEFFFNFSGCPLVLTDLPSLFEVILS